MNSPPVMHHLSLSPVVGVQRRVVGAVPVQHHKPLGADNTSPRFSSGHANVGEAVRPGAYAQVQHLRAFCDRHQLTLRPTRAAVVESPHHASRPGPGASPSLVRPPRFPQGASEPRRARGCFGEVSVATDGRAYKKIDLLAAARKRGVTHAEACARVAAEIGALERLRCCHGGVPRILAVEAALSDAPSICGFEAVTSCLRQASCHRVRAVTIVMSAAAGNPLASRAGTPVQLTATECREVMRQLVGLLAFCHSNEIFHGDVKPSNLMWDASQCRLTLVDFGESVLGLRIIGKGVHGTRGYIAPEQDSTLRTPLRAALPQNRLVRQKSCDDLAFDGGRADVWSAGATALALLTGAVPPMGGAFEEEHWWCAVMEALASEGIGPDSDCTDFIARALTVEPHLRPTSAELARHAWFSAIYPWP